MFFPPRTVFVLQRLVFTPKICLTPGQREWVPHLNLHTPPHKNNNYATIEELKYSVWPKGWNQHWSPGLGVFCISDHLPPRVPSLPPHRSQVLIPRESAAGNGISHLSLARTRPPPHRFFYVFPWMVRRAHYQFSPLTAVPTKAVWGACSWEEVHSKNHLIGSRPLNRLHICSRCLLVPLKGPRCHGTYLRYSFAALSCGRSPLCGAADIISFYTVDFMVGFALRFNPPRGCSPRKWLRLCS